jgi:hypothetical protein
MQDRVEQQQLKRLVLNYEQREEAEELKGMPLSVTKIRLNRLNPLPSALEAQSRPIKIRLAG